MTNFNQLLEQYVFAMATQVIDQLETSEQDQLIKLFASINANPLPTNEQLPVETALSPVEDPDCPLIGTDLAFKKTNRKALRLSQDRRVARNNTQTAYKKRLIALQQGQIDSALANIDRMKQLIQRAELHIVCGYRRTTLLRKYQSIIDGYVLFIAKLQMLQQKEINRLL
ncbi:hypothetical protein EXU85_16815 [Spirosoma sp. KCTC 42546]|uniref:hypothetical protein n=1 Tax=Spirosoma sp. KCTC 42546 TaxID=2520506 RepID=UPI00115BB2A0|nr:hypothetical protein [Spirosoma sp. KCTC 42546]QDK80175.1 hypothetical protein EXU85_16815 [Spirosoma sp. KCTC 42546]